MPKALGQLRGPPLLSPPAAGSVPKWLEVTEKDMELIRRSQDLSNSPECFPTAEAYFYLKELGLPARMSAAHREVIVRNLASLRSGDWNEDMSGELFTKENASDALDVEYAKMLYMAGGLGIGQLVPNDGMRLNYKLVSCRKRGWWDQASE